MSQKLIVFFSIIIVFVIILVIYFYFASKPSTQNTQNTQLNQPISQQFAQPTTQIVQPVQIAQPVQLAQPVSYTATLSINNTRGTYAGCYYDNENRVMKNYVSNLTLEKCYTTAKNAGATVFGLQFGNASNGVGECWYEAGKTLADVKKFGITTGCKPITDPATLAYNKTAQMGTSWTNALYTI